MYFAGYQHHVSLYPATERSVAPLPRLTPYRSGRGTLKFPLETAIPLALVKQFVRLRVKEELARTSRTAAGSGMSRSQAPRAGSLSESAGRSNGDVAPTAALHSAFPSRIGCPRPRLLSHFTPHCRILPRRLVPIRGTVESSPPLTSYSAGALCANCPNPL